jgi:hypothetical protein
VRRKIEKYAVFWNVTANEGQIIFQLTEREAGPGTATLLLDSPQEGQLVLDILRNEEPVYYDDEHDLIMTGLEGVGEEEDD